MTSGRGWRSALGAWVHQSGQVLKRCRNKQPRHSGAECNKSLFFPWPHVQCESGREFNHPCHLETQTDRSSILMLP